jgi:hypothetical protein
MNEHIWWVGFNAFLLVMLALDWGVFQRKAHPASFKESLDGNRFDKLLITPLNSGSPVLRPGSRALTP